MASSKATLYTGSDSARAAGIDKPATFDEDYRSPYRRDYARILHSPSFRRLQGKTQLFPSHESDFSRNRLTHSLEVAQVAKSIATQINLRDDYFKENNLEVDLVELAALAHDIGHPPGHNGEEALNRAMNGCGGFEGNAQSLRILGKLEKRQVKGGNFSEETRKSGRKTEDLRLGLNLTFRSLASVLKYYEEIPEGRRTPPVVEKGYYASERSLVERIVRAVCPNIEDGITFKTVECHIMDISDDIAYSTYDLEDAFKAGFLTPLKMISSDRDFKKKVADEVLRRCEKFYPDQRAYWSGFSVPDVDETLQRVFSFLVEDWGAILNEEYATPQGYAFWLSALLEKLSTLTATSGYARTHFTSDLVSRFVNNIEILHNNDFPMLTRVRLNIEAFLEVEVLKIFTFESLIMSPMLKLSEYRGQEIVSELFQILTAEEGHLMLPNDFRVLYERSMAYGDQRFANRVVCDFIAGMTDRYAIEFFSRLKGANPPSIHKPY